MLSTCFLARRLRWLAGLGLLLPGFLAAQPVPLPPEAAATGRYVFTVFTPRGTAEAPLWACGGVEMTTHRLRDRADSSQIVLPPARHASLRTYVTTGADAGAGPVVPATGGPPIAELLVYPFLLSPEQRQLTESYLALKHGITLAQHRPVNYLAPAADGGSYPVWTATADPDFRHRIVGLARDDASGLLRTAGSSVAAPELLRLSWATPPDTTAYVVIADDGAPTARAETTDDRGLVRLRRRWRVETTGPAPATVVAVDPARLFAQLRPGERWVLVASSADGTDHPLDPVAEAGPLRFRLPAGASGFQLAIHGATPPPDAAAAAASFTATRLSPNPVRAGTTTQLRVSLREAADLLLTVHDPSGRLLERRYLPATTHHLAELSFPTAGVHTLHLRTRHQRPAATTLSVVVQ